MDKTPSIKSKTKFRLLILFIIIALFIVNGCSHYFGGNGNNSESELTEQINIMNKYSSDYFLGFGQGTATTEQKAIKIARASALGELSGNIKVIITSKLEVITSEKNGSSNDLVSQKIIEIGNAIVRSPDIEILKSGFDPNTGKFEVKVLAKKLKQKHYDETLKSIDIEDMNMILNIMSEK